MPWDSTIWHSIVQFAKISVPHAAHSSWGLPFELEILEWHRVTERSVIGWFVFGSGPGEGEQLMRERCTESDSNWLSNGSKITKKNEHIYIIISIMHIILYNITSQLSFILNPVKVDSSRSANFRSTWSTSWAMLNFKGMLCCVNAFQWAAQLSSPERWEGHSALAATKTCQERTCSQHALSCPQNPTFHNFHH